MVASVVREVVSTRRDSTRVSPSRGVDTGMWKEYTPSRPVELRCPREYLTGRKHAIVVSGLYADWCITFDQVEVERIIQMAELPKMPVGDILSALRRYERE